MLRVFFSCNVRSPCSALFTPRQWSGAGWSWCTLPEALACACAEDGVSGGIYTTVPGCQNHDDDPHGAWCYVIDPGQCSKDTDSTRFPGSAWVYCLMDHPRCVPVVILHNRTTQNSLTHRVRTHSLVHSGRTPYLAFDPHAQLLACNRCITLCQHPCAARALLFGTT
jgi:hypothetical protein